MSNYDFRHFITNCKNKYPNDKDISKIYDELFNLNLQSNFIINFDLMGIIHVFKMDESDEKYHVFWPLNNINTPIVNQLFNLLNEIKAL